MSAGTRRAADADVGGGRELVAQSGKGAREAGVRSAGSAAPPRLGVTRRGKWRGMRAFLGLNTARNTAHWRDMHDLGSRE